MCTAGFGRYYKEYHSRDLRLHLHPHVAELDVSWKEVIVVTMALGHVLHQTRSARIGKGFSASLISSMESDTNEKVFHPR